MTSLGKSTHSPAARRQNSRLGAFSSECGPETEMVGLADFAAKDKMGKKATLQLNIQTCAALSNASHLNGRLDRMQKTNTNSPVHP